MSNLTLIEHFQREIAEENRPLSELLRKAKILASKFNLTDDLEWINQELNGYKSIDLPDFRIGICQLKAYNRFAGWQPVSNEKYICTNSIGEIEKLLQDKSIATTGMFAHILSEEARQDYLNSIYPEQEDIRLEIGSSLLQNILQAVRNKLLDWSLNLDSYSGSSLMSAHLFKDNSQNGDTTFHIGTMNNSNLVAKATDHAQVIQHSNIPALEFSQILEQLIQAKTLFPENVKAETTKLVSDAECLAAKSVVTETEQQHFLKKLAPFISAVLAGTTSNITALGIQVLLKAHGYLP